MADLYKGLPQNYGGFDPSHLVGGSGSAGYYQKAQGLPFYQGRSILATIPEYQRNPLMLEKDLMVKIVEGRSAMMRMLYDYAEKNGSVSVKDVRFKLPVEIVPHQRFYLKTGVYTTSSHLATFDIESNNTKIKTAHPQGNIKQKGDIARIEVGQFIMLMFSWVAPSRTAAPIYANRPAITAPIPELCKVIAVDYENSRITVQRNWAGEKRTSVPNAAGALTVHPSTYTASTAAGQAGTIPIKDAFFVMMAKSMQEDEIDSKIHNWSGTWVYGLLQRHLRAFGSQHLAETISRNLGIASSAQKTKKLAVEQFYKDWEWTSLFGEKSEDYDNETGYWSGTTDGLLTNVPTSHYINIRDIDYGTVGKVPFQTDGSYMGTFHPQIFNKLLEEKGYIGSQEKILLCGASFHTSFSTMINIMTQNLPEIKSEWRVEGRRFMSSNGLNINVIPSDLMSLHGLSHTGILVDPSFFKLVKLDGYPTDILQVHNENPLKENGFIHGIQGFIDLNPDAHWVFNLQPNSASTVELTGSPVA